MQQLLTGKTRLPGFTEPWLTTCDFGDVWLTVTALAQIRKSSTSILARAQYVDLATGGQIGRRAAVPTLYSSASF